MSTMIGPKSPTTVTSIAPGDVAWTNPSNAIVNDSNYSTASGFLSGAQGISLVKLVVGGVVVGDNLAATPTVIGFTATIYSFGDLMTMWGFGAYGLTREQINAADFGFVFACSETVFGQATEYLKAVDFGFNIPEGEGPVGIRFNVESRKSSFSPQVDFITADVWHDPVPVASGDPVLEMAKCWAPLT